MVRFHDPIIHAYTFNAEPFKLADLCMIIGSVRNQLFFQSKYVGKVKLVAAIAEHMKNTVDSWRKIRLNKFNRDLVME